MTTVCRRRDHPQCDVGQPPPFLAANVEPGSTVITDEWPSYKSATVGYAHTAINLHAPGAPLAHVALPGVHRISSLLKRWLLGTHHGRSSLITWSPTSTSSPSGSTVGSPSPAACSSTGS